MSITSSDLLVDVFMSAMIGFALWGATTMWDLSLSTVIIASTSVLILVMMVAVVGVREAIEKAANELKREQQS